MKPALDALRKYAALAHPSSALPPSTLLLSTPQTIAIFDAFPKAKYHFLVLPRYPFPPQSDPDSRTSLVQLDAFDDLRSLLKTSPDIREQVIDAMADTAREVEEMIRDEMIKTEGWEWRVDIGFHAIPSMKYASPPAGTSTPQTD
jgi:aprataxin